MSSINSVRNLQILNFSRKSNNIKNLKKCLQKVVLAPPFIYTTMIHPKIKQEYLKKNEFVNSLIKFELI